MKKAINLLALILCAGIFLTTSCNDDDEMNNASCTEGEFSFKLNGTLWEAESFNNTLIFANEPTTGLDTRRCDIRANNADGDQIILTFSNPDVTDDSCMKTGAYTAVGDATSSLNNIFFFTYIGSSLNFGTASGTLNLTSCDAGNNKQMEGTFTFEDILEENEGTEGTFKICIP